MIKNGTFCKFLRYYIWNKNQKNATVRTVLKSQNRIVERGKTDIPNKYTIVSWLGTDTSIRSGVVVLVQNITSSWSDVIDWKG